MDRVLFPALPVLLVDDELSALQSNEMVLVMARINNIIQCQDPRRVQDILNDKEVSAVLLDFSMPYISGERLLPIILAEHPEVPVIIVTGANSAEQAANCIEMGAFDYMVKPVEKGRLVSGVRRAVEVRELRRENELIRRGLFYDDGAQPEAFGRIALPDDVMANVVRYCRSIAKNLGPVFISGASGAAREAVARAIHSLSGRRGSFVVIKTGGLDYDAFADALFGRMPGGVAEEALIIREGLIAAAAGGTVFLEEFGDLSPEIQEALFRVLRTREYHPVGSPMTKLTDTRIIAATNRDFTTLRASGHFRKDLHYWLTRSHVPLPQADSDDLSRTNHS